MRTIRNGFPRSTWTTGIISAQDKNKAFGYCDTPAPRCLPGAKFVGRVMGIINARYNEHRDEKTARFGFLETSGRCGDRPRPSRPDRGVGAGQGDDPGRRSLRFFGPGPRRLHDRGLRARGDDRQLLQFRMDAETRGGGGLRQGHRLLRLQDRHPPKEMPEFYTKIYERAQKKGNFEVVDFTSKKQLKPWIRPHPVPDERMLHAEQHPYGYAPLDKKEMDDLARSVPVLDPRFIKIVRKDGEAVAFVIGMPDMTAGIPQSPRTPLPLRDPVYPQGSQEDQAARPSCSARSRTSIAAWAWT